MAEWMNKEMGPRELIESVSGKRSSLYRYYREMWLDVAEEFGPFERIGEHSLAFERTEGRPKEEVILDIFGIPEEKRDSFREGYDKAIRGNGNEGKRILTLRSSSLCALLHFYDRKREWLTIPLGEGRSLRLHVDKVEFEVKNYVFKGRAPSNVDILLDGEDEGGRRVKVFLESKFTEYIDGSGKKYQCSPEYSKEVLEPIRRSFKNITVSREGEKTVLRSQEKRYLGGLKQMCAHLRGIQNWLKTEKFVGKVYLGCIILPVPGSEFETFRTDYQWLAKDVNESEANPPVFMIPDTLSYKEDFPAKDPKVRMFYGEE